jgi:hypothetical protein
MGRLGHAFALSLLVTSGCNVVWGLERDPPPEFRDYDRCGAFLYDEPLRYATVTNPSGALPWSWEDARTACEYRGMDLAVFNDMHELGMAATPDAWPYWIGERMTGSSSETVDGCPAVNTPVSTRYVAADVTACGVVGAPLEINGASCDGALPVTMEPNVVVSALCETPRPDTVECLGGNPLDATYILSDSSMTYDAARAFCETRDAHLVVVETHAEWLFLAKQTKELWEKPFWLGSQLVQTKWETVTGCPGTYSWTNGTPGTPKTGSCVAAKLRVVDESEPDLSGTVLDGVEPTDCGDDHSFALCELD